MKCLKECIKDKTMAEILKGKPVADQITKQIQKDVEILKNKGITPTLAILRVGEREDDLSYERGAMKRSETCGISVKNVVLPADVKESEFFATLEALNQDASVHGILMFRPLPKHLDNEKARKQINPDKDVDGCTDLSLAGVFTNSAMGFAPCTAQAAVEMLDYYGIDVAGKNVAVLGRSLVVGKPVSMLLMNKNATVTVCHTKTVNTAEISKKADIIIACTGKMESLNAQYFSENQTVIDVGINFNEVKGKLCGDVLFEEAEPIVANISPVPKGVGSVTTAVLVNHVAVAAERTIR